MKKQVMPIGLAHQLYNPENYERDSNPAFESKKGLAEVGETFKKVKFCRVSLKSHDAFGVKLLHIVITARIQINSCMT
jgi:hypothetical protein